MQKYDWEQMEKLDSNDFLMMGTVILRDLGRKCPAECMHMHSFFIND
jgi:hypothetical protein